MALENWNLENREGERGKWEKGIITFLITFSFRFLSSSSFWHFATLRVRKKMLGFHRQIPEIRKFVKEI